MANLRHRSTTPVAPGAEHVRRCGERFATLLAAFVLLATASRSGVAQSPADTARALLDRAETLRGQHRLAESRDVYRLLVERDPRDFEYRFWLAKLEAWTGHFASAESLFVALVEERPDDYDSRIALADVRLWQGHLAEAEHDLEALARSHPSDAEVLYRLGRVREGRGDMRGARRDFADALRADPDHAEARAALQHLAPAPRWEMGVEYYGDQLSGAPASNGGSTTLDARPSDALRWRVAGTVQQKFGQTEARVGAELSYHLFRSLELTWSAYVAPGAEVLPRQTYGLGLGQKLGAGFVLYADYAFFDFADADVHRISPRLELYAGPHWLFSGRYAYASTSFTGVTNGVSNNAGSVSIGYLYGRSNLVQVFGGVGGESFALPARDAIGGFGAHTVGVGWRQFLTPWLGLSVFYAHQDRSDGATQESYGLGLVRKW